MNFEFAFPHVELSHLAQLVMVTMISNDKKYIYNSLQTLCLMVIKSGCAPIWSTERKFVIYVDNTLYAWISFLEKNWEGYYVYSAAMGNKNVYL
jgi:hypothetical protein